MSEHRVREALDPCCGVPVAAAISASEATTLATVFAALADPIRLRLFSIVASEGEVCSCDLEGPLERSQPTISHHTKILADAGLVVGERRGRWVWWKVVPERLELLERLLAHPAEHRSLEATGGSVSV